MIEQFDVPRFIAAVERLSVVRAPEALGQDLAALLAADMAWD